MRIHRQFFEYLLTQKEYHIKIKTPLPEDAHLVNSTYNSYMDTWSFLFHSKEFEVVPEGQEIPQFDVVITDVIAEKAAGSDPT